MTGAVRSADGTSIAFDAWGAGRPLVIVDGATSHRAVNPLGAEIGQELADAFRVYAYDRRGRGESTDTQPYTIEREIEDIAALIADGGGPAVVLGFSSGAVLAMDAVAAGLPVSHLALFEPPFVVDDVRPPLPVDYVEQLDRAVGEGRRDDAAALFMTAAAGMPPEAVEGMKQSPYWPPVVEVAHTIGYDGRIMGTTMSGHPLPTDRWAAITAPTLVMYGERTWPALLEGAKAAAEVLPTAKLLPVDGEQHSAPAHVLAPALRAFVGA